MGRAYPNHLYHAEGAYIEPHPPIPKAPGRPRVHMLRVILDAIFYILRSGCAWRLLPHDFPTAGRPSTITSERRARRHLGEGARRFAQASAGAHEARPSG